MGGAYLLATDIDDHWRGWPLTTYQDERWQMWVLGEFYGDQPDLPRAIHSRADLNGHFLILAFEVQPKRWHLLTDRFGTLHVYLGNKAGRTSLGTFSPAVAKAAQLNDLDRHALASFFTFGFFLGDTTHWQGLRVINPATHLVLDQTGKIIREIKTWDWEHQVDKSLTYSAAIEGFAERFDAVLRGQVKGKSVALPLSGGLDSRSTLIPLTSADQGSAASLFPFSYGYTKDSVETKIAAQLARKRNLPLQTWTIKPYLFDQLQDVLAATEGFQDLTLARQAYVVDQLGVHATHVLAAHWGDVWLDDMGFLGQTQPLSDTALADKLVGKFSKKGSAFLLYLFKESFPQDIVRHQATIIEQQLNALQAITDPDFKVKAWKTQAWSFRWTLASLRMYQAGLHLLLPFYDQRLADFFCTLPSQWVAGRKLQIDYLKKFGPDLARVTWQPYDANLYNYQHFNTWLLPKRAFKKLGRMLSYKKVIQRNWEVQFLNPQGKKELQNWILTPGLKLHSFVERKKLESILSDFYTQPNAAKGYAASMVLTFSAWLEAYG